MTGRANRPGRAPRFTAEDVARFWEWRVKENLCYREIAEREGTPLHQIYYCMTKEKGPVPTNGNEANERIPGERLELSPYENSTSPATPSATAEERA